MRGSHRPSALIVVTIAAIAAIGTSGAARVSAQDAPGPTAPVVPAELASAPETAKLTYWVVLRERANLTAAPRMAHDARGRFVVEQLRSAADRSQAGLRGFLRARGIDYEPFWAANVIRVISDKATLAAVARRPEVERIEIDRIYQIPEPQPGALEAAVQAVEWNIANVRALEVWGNIGTRGDGIVVGSIDTGTQFNHPALVRQYRGNLGGGLFDHNYNWNDPAHVCGNPSTAPCDNNRHGTHTLGTIVGDDGAGNQIGVAPAARWITAKGCEGSSCSLTALVAAGQWMLAPTDLNGQNPRPDLRPHIVSNSWGGGAGNTFYQQIVQSWVAAGIFPVFANGNTGPNCGTAGSPGDYPESYAVGAYDASNLIASFSSRGASAFGGSKPNISAPGVNVRSSVPGNTYAVLSGTSMATPHIAGIAALMWSAAPALVGDVAATRRILDAAAIDAPDLTCGGTAANNNVYGEGRADAFAAVEAAPRGPVGTLQGTVTDLATGNPLVGIELRAEGASSRTMFTNAAGAYSLTAPVGSYDVTVSGFGYLSQTAYGLWILEGASAVHDFAITPGPSVTLSGTVEDSAGTPIPNATVTVAGTPLAPATTDAKGAFRFDAVPPGTYDIRADAGRCNQPQMQRIALTSSQNVDFMLPARTDSFGYSCASVPQSWIDGTSVLPVVGDDAKVSVPLPFEFSFYGNRYSAVTISVNGFLAFVPPAAANYSNTAIPATWEPNAAVYALWDDLSLDASSIMRTGTVGVPPNRKFVVEWLNIAFFGEPTSRVDVEVVLGEGGDVLLQYRNISNTSREQGGSATIGLENASGTVGLQYAINEPVISEGLSLRYSSDSAPGIQGVIKDANDGLAVAAATVRALQNGGEVARMTTDASGHYRFDLAAGSYSIEAAAARYETKSATVNLTTGGGTTMDLSLRTPRVEVNPTSVAFTLWVGQSGQQTLSVANTGGLTAQWQLTGTGGWLSLNPTSGTSAPGTQSSVQVTVSASGLAGGTYAGSLQLQSNSGRRPSLSIPVSLTVTQYAQGVNAAGRGYTSPTGEYWSPDAPYAVNGWGYVNAASTVGSTKRTIASTTDVPLFQSQRVAPGEYRFDGLAPGTYAVTVGFAEYRQLKPGARVVDIVAEGITVIPGHDVMSHAGVYVADTHTFTVGVSDGQLNLLFLSRPGSEPAIVNAIRVVRQQ